METVIRRRAPHKLKKSHKAAIIIAVILSLAIMLISYVNNKLDPLVALEATVQSRNTVSEMINKATARALAESGIGYEELVNIRLDANGKITSISANTMKMTELQTKITEYIIEDFNNYGEFKIEISFSNMFDDEVIFGRFPNLMMPASIDPQAAVESTLESEFISAGINQTLHKIYADINAKVCILTLISNVEFELNAKVALAETVIVGDVPRFYMGGK